MVAGATVAAVYGIVATPDASELAYSSTAGSGLGRIAGTVGDPNELASLLVVGLVLSGALAATSSGGQRAIWMVRRGPVRRSDVLDRIERWAGGPCRGSHRRDPRGAAPPRAGHLGGPDHRRVGDLLLHHDCDQEAQDRITLSDGGTGGTDIWRIGWRMFEDKPIQGVGANNFQVASIHYLLAEPGAIENDTYVVDQPAVAHNSTSIVLAELGLIGFVLFMLVLGLILGYLIKAIAAFKRLKNRTMEILATALVLSLVALLAADFFLSEQYSKQLWILLALAPALYAMAQREEAELGRAPPTGTF